MVKIDRTDVERVAVSSVAALAVSAACMFAALAPAKAAAEARPMSAATWQHRVENRLDNVHERSNVAQPTGSVAVSQVAVQLSPDGKIIDAAIARSSGDRAIDRRAVNVARALRYPAMPAGFRTGSTMVRMTLYFGPDAAGQLARDVKKHEGMIQLAAM